MAVNTRKGKEEVTDWFRCSMWGVRGEKLSKYIEKGAMVCVSGEFTSREYTDKNDKARTSLEIKVEGFSFAGGKRDDSAGSGAGPASDYAAPALGGDDMGEIPF